MSSVNISAYFSILTAVAAVVVSSIRIAKGHERGVVLRLGPVNQSRSP